MVRAFLHYGMMGGVAIEMRVVLIEFGVVFIGGWGYLTKVTRFCCVRRIRFGDIASNVQTGNIPSNFKIDRNKMRSQWQHDVRPSLQLCKIASIL